MIFLCFILIPVIYVAIKLILFFLVKKYGYLSYNGFNAFGFKYDRKQDAFYSSKYAFQREFGYCYLYDLFAPLFNLIIDTERITFKYNHKNYLICFWKGQYGICTGGEIGIYETKSNYVNKNTLYLKVPDEDMLDMGFTLCKNNEILSKVHDKHWWLTSFKLGMFSKPKQLTMKIQITFKNNEMLTAFIESFRKLGHKKDYQIINNTFYYDYKKSKSKKVWTRWFLSDMVRMHINKKNTILYNKYVNDIIENDKKAISVNEFIPKMLQNKECKLLMEPIKTVILYSDDIYSSVGKYE